jgi:5-methylcytosine-specific restriction endonuclease McrA
MEAALRKAVWDRARSTCEYCRMPQPFDCAMFEVEHVVPEKHGGLIVLENLALACFFCNRYKGPNLSGIDPESRLIVTLFDPRRDLWSQHFRWEDAVLRGLTQRGRATIVVLRINDAPRMAHRELLIASGDFSG